VTERFDDVEAIVASGDDADDVLRAVVDALVAGGCAWAGILFAEQDELVLGPQAGTPDPDRRLQVPVRFQGDEIAALAADGCDDEAALARVAALVAAHCLVGWDTAGERWEP
jgi:putative methionine-R-sulfoxide reductase with GAF domain